MWSRSLNATFAAVLLAGCSVTLLAQPQPSSPEDTSSVATMQAIEDTWDSAIAKHDQFALENLLAGDYVGIAANGDITTRNQQIAHLFVAGAEPLSVSQKVISARVMGDLAVVNGTYTMKWPGVGETVSEKGVFTQVFRKSSAGNWQCMNSQHTVVATEEDRKKAAAKTKSNATLPLHIPLLYHGAQSSEKDHTPAGTSPQQ